MDFEAVQLLPGFWSNCHLSF